MRKHNKQAFRLAAQELTALKRDSAVQKAVDNLLSWGTDDLKASRAKDLFAIREDGKIVFRTAAIGSLAWQPVDEGGAVDVSYHARIPGYERSLCSYSRKRGNPDQFRGFYGLSIGVDRKKDSLCPTIVQEVVIKDAKHAAETVDGFVVRETVNGIYKFGLLPNHVSDNHVVPALTCIANPAHKYYVGDTITLDKKAQLIAYAAVGKGGKKDKGMTCLQYYLAFAKTFDEVGASDHMINAVTLRAAQYRLAMPKGEQAEIKAVEKHGGFSGEEPNIDAAQDIFQKIYPGNATLKEMETAAVNAAPDARKEDLRVMKETLLSPLPSSRPQPISRLTR